MTAVEIARRTYAGIGSRRTPAATLALMTAVAQELAIDGGTLRSGGARGADQAFQAGARMGEGAMEMYLPWRTFEAQALATLGEVSVRIDQPARAAYEIAARHHPNWFALTTPAQRLHARNAHQILGSNLEPTEAVRFVICWTPDGSIDGLSRASGGTGQALRIAVAHDVEVFNLARPDHEQRVRALLQRCREHHRTRGDVSASSTHGQHPASSPPGAGDEHDPRASAADAQRVASAGFPRRPRSADSSPTTRLCMSPAPGRDNDLSR
jgi:hypothetical protein